MTELMQTLSILTNRFQSLPACLFFPSTCPPSDHGVHAVPVRVLIRMDTIRDIGDHNLTILLPSLAMQCTGWLHG